VTICEEVTCLVAPERPLSGSISGAGELLASTRSPRSKRRIDTVRSDDEVELFPDAIVERHFDGVVVVYDSFDRRPQSNAFTGDRTAEDPVAVYVIEGE
jgi:hypothetical protein